MNDIIMLVVILILTRIVFMFTSFFFFKEIDDIPYYNGEYRPTKKETLMIFLIPLISSIYGMKELIKEVDKGEDK